MARRPRPKPALFVAGAVVLAAAIAVPVVVHLRDEPEAPHAPPQAYTVTYRVHISAGGNDTSTYEVLSARRPFDVSDLTFPSAPLPGVAPTAGTITTETELYDVTGSGVQAVSGRVPAPGTGDQYLLADRADLVARGLARRTGHQRVAGRGCDVYELAEPPAGAIAPLPSNGDHDFLCIDADGLILGEQWTYHGTVVEVREAQSVSTDPAAVTVASVVGAAPQAATAATTTPADAAAVASHQPSVAAPPAPAGFTPAGVFAAAVPDPQQPKQIAYTSIVWAFTAGPRSVTVESGDGRVPWQATGTVTADVHLRGLGPAVTAVDSDGPDVRVDLGSGRWVRVRGTGTVAQLVAYADQLRRS